ncbi:hypothetical protein, partial [Pararhizobium antarcticum]|uniref:hypothetical protein n=1 Tax=Pararhizobium antarcticum TaxID=1798805 RepID=UPI001AECE98A
HGVDPQALLHSSQKRNRWPDFTPPAAGLFRRYRGRLLHRRSHEAEDLVRMWWLWSFLWVLAAIAVFQFAGKRFWQTKTIVR